ncbi:hypothetical protein [Haloarchaeobius amylolyticus]|uniref:hypothetical protein n=1 Tax=Haloarchaeobius amylolyticus TaxID=1198296 RepID=UPI00226EADC0|nr:hypothetical protein [Haloarchaeobius amylolyticus]
MTPDDPSPLQDRFTVYVTFCLTGLVALAFVTGLGIRGNLGVVVAFVVMGLLAVGLLFLYGQHFTRQGEAADPPLGPNGDGR